MPKIAYITKRFSPKTIKTMEQVGEIIQEWQEQGFSLTVRQVYYQLIAKGIIEGSDEEYTRIKRIISDGRLTGELDWNGIEDRTRGLKQNSHWNGPKDILETAATQYRVDKGVGQEYRFEVWIEKDALVGVIAGTCARLDIPYFSCRGYNSQSEMWLASQRFSQYIDNGQKPLVLYFGDHDPSGMHMSEDIQSRLRLFMGGIEFERLALNMDQIEKFKPPPNPAKMTDPRARFYIPKFGTKSWELDALKPSVFTSLIEDAAERYRDKDIWQEACDREASHKEKIREFANTIE